MAYRKKIYVAFDNDDIIYYNMLQAWCASDTQELLHHSMNIPTSVTSRIAENALASLSEKVNTTTCVIVLISEHTMPLSHQVQSEIEKAVELGKPIIVANINGKRSIDNDLCPEVLKEVMAVHISFNAKIIQRAIDTWPTYCDNHSENGSGAYFFNPEVYQKLGV